MDLEGGARAVHALADAREPAVRAFAYESLTRRDVWTIARIEQALADTAVVPHADACSVDALPLASLGVDAAIAFPDRAAVLPAMRAWATSASPQLLARAYAERGSEAWVDLDRARAIHDDPKLPVDVRAAAAVALAEHGEPLDTARLLAWARGPDDWRDDAIRALDALGYASAWNELADGDWVPPALLMLGAHWVPDEAVVVLDAEAGGGLLVLELPPRLRTPRLGHAVCAVEPFPLSNPSAQARRTRATVAAALDAAPESARCDAFLPASSSCSAEGLQRRAYAISEPLARRCGIAPPPETTSVLACERDGDERENLLMKKREQDERARVLELERRAKQALEDAG